jgi:5-formyltetrahydrofolate cyclo-ligase
MAPSPTETADPSSVPNEKAALRSRLLGARRELTPDQRTEAAAALAEAVCGLPELTGGAGTVAAYVSVGTEPGTRALLGALRERGVRMLLPVLRADDDLDWGVANGRLVPGRMRGLLEPAGPRLGVDAVREAGVILLPGLAVDGGGLRLGRGGGSYDRVLERLRRGPGAEAETGTEAAPLLAVLLYPHELLPTGTVPSEPHDHRVDLAATPHGVTRFRRPIPGTPPSPSG